MLLTILLSTAQMALAAANAAQPAAPDIAVASPKCQTRMHQADGDTRPAVRRLDQLPPGRLELTVLRQLGHCPEAVVLREGIGGNSDSPDRPLPDRR